MLWVSYRVVHRVLSFVIALEKRGILDVAAI
jgi:hypothetical protein